jgi:hypothetical protein
MFETCMGLALTRWAEDTCDRVDKVTLFGLSFIK